MENSIEEDIERLKLCSTNQYHICGRYEKEECMLERNRCEQHLLSDYKRVLKENEELKQKNCELRMIMETTKDLDLYNVLIYTIKNYCNGRIEIPKNYFIRNEKAT